MGCPRNFETLWRLRHIKRKGALSQGTEWRFGASPMVNKSSVLNYVRLSGEGDHESQLSIASRLGAGVRATVTHIATIFRQILSPTGVRLHACPARIRCRL